MKNQKLPKPFVSCLLSAVVGLLTFSATVASAQSSAYSNAVVALGPAGYWPMHEQAAPAPGNIETNYGSLGALGNGYYSDWWINNRAPGNLAILHQNLSSPLINDPDPSVFFMYPPGTNTYLLVPHTSPLTTLRPPFTIELWMFATNTAFGDLVSQDGTILNGGNGNNQYGVRVTWGGGSGYDTTKRIFQVYNGITTASGYVTGQWHYVVMACDISSNYTLYVDNALAGTKTSSGIKPDAWDPLTIGAGMWNAGGVTRETALGMDEVAVYTNALGTDRIAAHYLAATSSTAVAGDYFNAIMTDTPLLYYRMNSPAYAGWPDPSTWPVLHNYGSTAGNGAYAPGVMPGAADVTGFVGLISSHAMPGNGLNAFADAGYDPVFDPTNHAPLSVAACFKGNPAESRYQNIAGHSDNSWRLSLDPNGKLHFNVVPGGANDAVSSKVYNDGNWHQVVAVYDGISNNIYADGILDGQTLVGTNTIPGSTNHVLLGADPQYLTINTGAGRQFAGNLCEVAFFTNALTSAQVRSLFNAVGAPVSSITAPVLSRVANSDVFTVVATGSSPVYQWYYNTAATYDGATALADGGGVSGSASASITIADLTGYYFAVATNNWGAVTSSIAQVPQTLTTAAAGRPIWNKSTQTNILVSFSDILDPASATALGNYSLDNGASISSVRLVASNEVLLVTSTLDTNISYSLTVQGVSSYWGILQTPSPSSLPVGLYPANIAFWLRADTGVTTDPGANTVSQWNDISGNNNHFYQGGGATLEPQLVTNIWGDPVIRFTPVDNSTNNMVAFSSPTLSISGDMSIVAVVNLRSKTGRSGHIVSKTGDPSRNIAAPYDCYIGGTATALFRGNGNGTVNGVNYGQFTGTQGPAVGYPYVIAISETGNTVSHYLNGKAAGTGLLSNNYQEANDYDQGNPVYIGSRSDNYNRLMGDLSEMIVAASPISSYDAAALADYLSVQHRFVLFNPNPTNIVVSVSGNQETLSWPADHTGWLLQSNSVGLMATNAWFPVNGSTLTNQITITPGANQTNVFYRMQFQQP